MNCLSKVPPFGLQLKQSVSDIAQYVSITCANIKFLFKVLNENIANFINISTWDNKYSKDKFGIESNLE